MSLRELYEAVLVEINKEQAPNILLEDFNYFANKTVYNYINKRYNIYDVNQQTTDDLRVLKATATLPVHKMEITENADFPTEILKLLNPEEQQEFGTNFMKATYTVTLPDDYYHILNCECFYKVNHPFKCYNKGNIARASATRLTADMWSQVVDNYWNQPTYYRPYYYINNVNTNPDVPTNKVNEDTLKGTDINLTNKTINEEDYKQGDDPFKIIDINGFVKSEDDMIYPQRQAQVRYGNASKVIMEIRYGQDDSTFELFGVMIDYIKTPQELRLTQDQIDRTLDESQILEFPDYVCQQIVNELVLVIMENVTDPRIQTHAVVNQSIANPVQQQSES